MLAIFGLLAFAGAALSLSVLPDQTAEFSREPEDVYLAIFWAISCFLLGAFMVAAALRAHQGRRRNRLRDYIAAALTIGIGMLLVIMGGLSTVDALWLIPLGLCCIGAAVAYLRHSRPVH
jgi:peptidoglycan/LPS O-acetylase OafA/YrhL